MLKTDSSKEYVNRYLDALNTTKSVRYAASSRLAKKNSLSLLTVSILSIYVIVASIIPVFWNDLSHVTTDALYFFSAICSLFIIVLSLVESGKDYKTRSELLLKCARRIGFLVDRINYLTGTNVLTRESFEQIQDEYNKILSEFTTNHDPIDYICHSKARSKNLVVRLQARLRYFTNVYLYYITLLLIPPVTFLLIF
jgi:hypothetical protein